MPLTLTVTQGVLPEGSEKLAFRRLGEAMLKWHGLAGNPVLTPNLVGSVIVLSPRETFAGLEESPVAFVEWRVPAFVFAAREVQQGYIAEVTDIIHEMSGGKLPKDHIWVNVVHAVDGAWGIGGRAMTNTELLEAVASA